MKSKVILTLWLISCPFINTPIMGASFDDYDDPAMKEVYEELKSIRSFARRLSGEEENLKLFYNEEWLPVTLKTLETVVDIREEIIETTEKANYVSLASSTVSVVGGILGIVGNLATVPVSLLSSVVPYSTSITIGGLSFRAITGLGRYSMSTELCKIADRHIGTSKRYTNIFHKKLQTYFENLEKFKMLLNKTGRNDATILLFHKIAKSEGFLENLNLNEQTKTKLQDILLQIIENDTSKVRPYMRTIELAESVYGGAKTLAGKISIILNELKDIVSSNPNQYYVIVDEIFGHNDWSKNGHPFGFKTTSLDNNNGLTRTAPLIAFAGLSDDASTFLTEKFASIKSITSKLLKNKMVLASLKAILVAVEVYDAGKTIVNLQSGSTSVESEELLKVINKMQLLRKELMGEIKVRFGW